MWGSSPWCRRRRQPHRRWLRPRPSRRRPARSLSPFPARPPPRPPRRPPYRRAPLLPPGPPQLHRRPRSAPGPRPPSRGARPPPWTTTMTNLTTTTMTTTTGPAGRRRPPGRAGVMTTTDAGAPAGRRDHRLTGGRWAPKPDPEQAKARRSGDFRPFLAILARAQAGAARFCGHKEATVSAARQEARHLVAARAARAMAKQANDAASRGRRCWRPR